MSRTILALTFLACVLLPDAVSAESASEQDEARQALERGEIRPLDQVLDAARKRLPGDVVKVELERDDGQWVYEIKILTASGERRKVEIDAKSLHILEID